MSKEIIWKDVKGYEGIYRLNSKGEIWRCRMVGCEKYELIKQLNSTGQGLVGLSKDGKAEYYPTHTLIYDHFNSQRIGAIKFIDGNKSNMSVDNMKTIGSVNYTKGMKGRSLNLPVTKIRQWLRKGETYNNIGKKLGCSGETVKNYIRTADVKNLLRKGYATKDISKKLNLKASVVKRTIKRLEK